jgi:hypothetical protein
MNRSTEPSNLTPFYFVNVVWGEEYRNYLLEYSLPSLLAPGNIPAIAGIRPARFLIATTAADWDIMRDTAIFGELEKYAEPVFLKLPPQGDRPYWAHSIIGHEMCCATAARDKAIRIFTAPDAVYSDRMVTRMHELSEQGVEVILKLVSPTVEAEAFFNVLDQMHLMPKVSARDTGHPLSFSGRELYSAAVRSMHSMTVVNEWRAPYFCGYVATPWWRVPGEDGIVLCGASWDLMLMDYRAIKQHDQSVLNERGFDGDYIMRTAGNLETFYAIRDSDDVHVVSWSANPQTIPKAHPFGKLGKAAAFRASFNSPNNNWLHRKLLFLPTRVHGAAISEKKWKAVEETALAELVCTVEPPSDIGKLFRGLSPELRNFSTIDQQIAACPLPWWRRNGCVWPLYRDYVMPTVARLVRLRSVLFLKLNEVLRQAKLALSGNPTARKWFGWQTRKLFARLLRRSFAESRPE